jgi:quercetin dioxygenase-like cupin family protein
VPSDPAAKTVLHRIAADSHGPALDLFGATIEILSRPAADDNSLCVLRGVVPAGVTVPLHSHEDAEDFYILAGTQQVLTHDGSGLVWADVSAGDYVRVPPGTMHAHRNVSDLPAIDLIVTTARLGRFFEEAGRPVTDSPQPPSQQDLARFVNLCVKYGYVLGMPEENAAVGIETPKFAAD